MVGDLDDILSGTDTAVAPEVEETEEVETGDTGQAAEVAQAPEVTPTSEPPEERVPVAAVIAERRKRQELEKQLATFQAQQAPAPDFYADPENYIQNTLKQNSLQMSVAMVEAQHPDFRDKLAVFLEEVNVNPVLMAQLEAHPHPALFAYQQASKIEQFRKMQDLPAFEAQLRAEIEARVRAEIGSATSAKQAAAAAIPPDLSGVRGAKSSDIVAHESLDQLLKGKR